MAVNDAILLDYRLRERVFYFYVIRHHYDKMLPDLALSLPPFSRYAMVDNSYLGKRGRTTELPIVRLTTVSAHRVGERINEKRSWPMHTDACCMRLAITHLEVKLIMEHDCVY